MHARHAVVHDAATHRFEIRQDGHVAFVSYVLRPGVVVFEHTIVPEALGGRGIGSALARHVLDWAAAQGRKVDPQCPFIRGWIDKHPEYQANSLAHGA